MNHNCDGCRKPIKKVGKLFKVGYMMLCKSCRTRYRMGKMGISIKEKVVRKKKKRR